MSSINQKTVQGLAEFYRKHLLEDIMPFWDKRAIDPIGGYFTSFDREGNLTDSGKPMCMQARMLWTFSAIYNEIEQDEKWLTFARHGRDFIKSYGYAGGGRWNYWLDQTGDVGEGSVFIFSGCFVLNALSK